MMINVYFAWRELKSNDNGFTIIKAGLNENILMNFRAAGF